MENSKEKVIHNLTDLFNICYIFFQYMFKNMFHI